MDKVEHFYYDLTLNAPATVVYDALVMPAGLRGWWSTDADVATHVGGRTRFNWSASDHTVFRIDRLTPASEIDWTCTNQCDRNLPQPDEWVGTRVSFRLTEDVGKTRLSLVHYGLRPLACYEQCQRGWDYFLGTSLKQLVEVGHGHPVGAPR